MFADLLKKSGILENRFVGHVGGDDFFVCIRGGVRSDVEAQMRTLALTFKKNAESFYDKESIEDAGNIIAMLKKEAKNSGYGLAYASIMEFLCMDIIPQLFLHTYPLSWKSTRMIHENAFIFRGQGCG